MDGSTARMTMTRGSGARPGLVEALAGAWLGRLIDRGGAVESFNLEGGAPDYRNPAGFQRFTTPGGIAASARLLEAGEQAFAVLVGPYRDPHLGIMVVTVLEGRHDSGRLEGEFQTRPHGGRAALRRGWFHATRLETVTRAA